MKCSICGYNVRGPNHDKGTHHLLHKDAPGKYLPGTQTPVKIA
jgi:hypothetical protein